MFREDAGTLLISSDSDDPNGSRLFGYMFGNNSGIDATIVITIIAGVSIISLFVLIILKKKIAHK